MVASPAPRLTRRPLQADVLGLGRLGDDDGLFQDRLGGGQVLLEEQRRRGEHVADVVEAVADVVGGEIGGGLEIDADQVADRVVVFGPVEAADGDAADVGRFRAIEIGQDAFDRLDDRFDARRRAAAWRSDRRHFAGAEHVQDVVPDFAVLLDREIVGVLVERQVGLVFAVLLAVAVEAVGLEEGEDVLLKGDFCGGFARDRLSGRAAQWLKPSSAGTRQYVRLNWQFCGGMRRGYACRRRFF